MATSPLSSEFSLIDLVLADQRDMTAVERFSALSDNSPPAQKSYRSLIPLHRPKPGEQYAFVVDMDRCSGCKACVSACHSLNGLDENEMWRSVGTIVGEEERYLQTVTSSCHHCVDPACASGCPVLAYDKDPVTGIVRHLDDQCIGCQYCVLKCPYEVPKYSKARGIVRKCDMCAGRLAAGEAPACAQACPHEAIRIEIVEQNVVRTQSAVPGARLTPGAFPSSYTLPTTRYESARPFPARVKPDRTRLEDSHWPLVFMLVLTQMAAGLHLVNTLFRARELAVAAALALIVGLNVSVTHLGRPLKAWRAFLGWKRSWMSREILAFSAYAGLAVPLIVFPGSIALAAFATFAGLAGVLCSAMIYVDTRRPSWSASKVFPDFLGDVLLFGTLLSGAITLSKPLLVFGFTLRILLFAWRCTMLKPALQLAKGTFVAELIWFTLSLAFCLGAFVDYEGFASLWAGLAVGSTFAGQILHRRLFFAATPAPRMPGVVSA